MVDASTVANAAKWIADSLVHNGEYLYGIEGHVEELRHDLESMQEFLYKVDADPSLVKEDSQLRCFSQNIRELAFRAEDAIDTFVVDVGVKIYGKALPLPVKIGHLLSHCAPLYTLRKEIEAIQKEMQKAKERFESFSMIQKKLDASSSGSRRRETDNAYIPSENYIHLHEVVVGIDDAVSQLVEDLTGPNHHFRVLGIVGTGGAGKSTLAAQLYRHNQVSKVFPRKAFVTVSQKWSKYDLLKRIYKQLKGDKQSKGDKQLKGDEQSKEDDISSSVQELVEQIRDFIKKNQCLVVLDDVWRKSDWDFICRIFPDTSEVEVEVGYRVILTTRNEEVPWHADNNCRIHKPEELTKRQKRELFRKLAIEGRPQIQENIDEFEKLGKQMVDKCPGSPLAVVTLAGILRTKWELYQWEAISKTCRANILKGKGGPNYGKVQDMLELSYLDLPIHLKPCFLYLAIFPELYSISARYLIQLWIGEGFITSDQQETLEDVGMRFVDELAQRCILQVTKKDARNQIETFQIHALMRDLCVKKAEEYKFVATVSATNANAGRPNQPSQPRRFAISSWKNVVIESQSVRSILDFAESDEELSDEARERKSEQLEGWQLLRVLEWYDEVPKRIGEFIHLRYLSLTVESCGQIPKSIKNLRNLFYFWFISTEDEVEVPIGLFCNMKNLRLFSLPFSLKRGSESLDTASLGLTGLENLQSLTSGAGKWMLNELPALSPTVREIYIENIRTPEEIEAVYQCPSVVEDRLGELSLVHVDGEDLEFDLQTVGHCETLWSLYLDGCLVMGDPVFPPNLMELYLWHVKMEEGGNDLMQALGELSNLKFLTLLDVHNCGKVVSLKAGAFPQLQELELIDLDTLEELMMLLSNTNAKASSKDQEIEFTTTQLQEQTNEKTENERERYLLLKFLLFINIKLRQLQA